MSRIYYAVVEGDPLDNGNAGQVIIGASTSTIADEQGRSRRQTHLGDTAWCGVCKSSGPIVAGADITQSLRGYDEQLGAFEAVGGDFVVCKCSRPPQIISVHARNVMYVDSDRASPGAARFATQSSRTYDEQVTASARGVSVEGYPYFIETSDGQKVCGRADDHGRLPRIYSDNADTYAVYWGDEALSHRGWIDAE
ncbi:conserved hypothetical protein [Paraburkholderia sabiae]|uniref:PAAR domain-containing protein n=1 Tax=Paraburkholderia sabiae TaxID=273251 RepID=UPI001CB4FB9E|nr:PAAR domain-containing protein [Paraburkholderia sabiae]CAG9189838.1 conserved hypothetical protein [Paraburkholderia sabiae]